MSLKRRAALMVRAGLADGPALAFAQCVFRLAQDSEIDGLPIAQPADRWMRTRMSGGVGKEKP